MSQLQRGKMQVQFRPSYQEWKKQERPMPGCANQQHAHHGPQGHAPLRREYGRSEIDLWSRYVDGDARYGCSC